MDRVNLILDIVVSYNTLSDAAQYLRSTAFLSQVSEEGSNDKLEDQESLNQYYHHNQDKLDGTIDLKSKYSSFELSNESGHSCSVCTELLPGCRPSDLKLSVTDRGFNNARALKARGMDEKMFLFMVNNQNKVQLLNIPVCGKNCTGHVNIILLCKDCQKCNCPQQYPENREENSFMMFPINENGADYVNRQTSHLKHIPYNVIENGLSGTFAEFRGRCSRCINCKQCKELLNNQAVSIKQIQEDIIFYKSVVINDETGKITATLPIDSDYRNKLPNNRDGCAKNLRHGLRKVKYFPVSRGQINETHHKYKSRDLYGVWETLTEYEQECINRESLQHYNYVTFAFKSDSDSTKARSCMNASSQYKGYPSLNSLMPIGTSNIDLVRSVQRLLSRPCVIVGDISIFYCSFHLDPAQFHIQRYLWQEDLDPEGELTEYFIKRLFFGLAPVGRLTSVGLEKIGELYPEIQSQCNEDFYVDDLVLNHHLREECRRLRDLIEDRLARHGLKFKSFIESGCDPGDNVNEEGFTLLLGLKYYPKDDKFGIKVPRNFKGRKVKGNIEKLEFFKGTTAEELKDFLDRRLTQRQLLSKVMQIFDPTGITSPLLGGLRQLIREGNVASQGQFDLTLPEELLDSYCSRVMELEKLRGYLYPRTNHRENPGDPTVDILAFADCGEHSRQIIQYTRMKLEGNIPNGNPKYSISFLGARNSLVMLGSTIPKGELDALFLTALAVEAEARNLRPYTGKKIAFTDSTITALWVSNWSITLNTFQRHRVSQILDTFTDSQGIINIYWVRRELQIADTGTHGKATPEQVAPDSDFYKGPKFIHHDLKEAEDKGLIVRVDKLKQHLNDEQLKSFNEGIVQRHRKLNPVNINQIESPSDNKEHEIEGANDGRLEGALDKAESNTQSFLSAEMNKVKRLFVAGKYLMNPFRFSFNKIVLTHMAIFRAIKCWYRHCINSKRETITHSYERNLNNLVGRSKRNMGFSLYCKEEYQLFKAECLREEIHKDNRERRLRYLGDNNKPANVAWLILERKYYEYDSESEHEGLTSPQASYVINEVPTETKNKVNLRTWNKYPGMTFCNESFKILNEYLNRQDNNILNRMEIVLMTAAFVNIQRYIASLHNHEFTTKIAQYITGQFSLIESNLSNDQREEMIKVITELSLNPLDFIKNPTHPQIMSLYYWLKSSTISLGCKFKYEKVNKVAPYIPRIIWLQIFPSRAEFAQMQLITFEFFHQILTRELDASWSKEKIEKNCERIDGKLVSTWRLRAGHEASQLLTRELSSSGVPLIDVHPMWNSIIPVGSKDSPLIISMCYHLHYSSNPNLLDRPKMTNHSGNHRLRMDLFQSVYVPSVLELFRRISHNCASCRIRTDKYIRMQMGPLPDHSLNVSPVFAITQLDGFGPFKFKTLDKSRLTRNSVTTQYYILVFVCCFSKLVHYELVEDQTPASFIMALLRLACRYQLPAKVICDRHASQVQVMKHSDFHIEVNNTLLQQRKLQYDFVPVGDHTKSGLVEAKIKTLGKLLAAANLSEGKKFSIIQFQTILAQFAELANSTPIGITQHKEHDPLLQILTPNSLAGSFPKRTALCSPEIPRDITGYLQRHKELWERVISYYSDAILPEMVNNKKWFVDQNSYIEVGSIIMFKKQKGDYILRWSYGEVIDLPKSSDNKPRKAQIRYLFRGDEEGGKVIKTSENLFHTTTRDINDLIILHPITDRFNQDLAELHYDIEKFDNERYEDKLREGIDASLMCESVSYSTSRDRLRCEACMNAPNIPLKKCSICLLYDSSIHKQQYHIIINDILNEETEVRRIGITSDNIEKLINELVETFKSPINPNHLNHIINKVLIRFGAEYIYELSTPIILEGSGYNLIVKQELQMYAVIKIDTIQLSKAEVESRTVPMIREKHHQIESIFSENVVSNECSQIDFNSSKIKWPFKPLYALNRSPANNISDSCCCICEYSYSQSERYDHQYNPLFDGYYVSH